MFESSQALCKLQQAAARVPKKVIIATGCNLVVKSKSEILAVVQALYKPYITHHWFRRLYAFLIRNYGLTNSL